MKMGYTETDSENMETGDMEEELMKDDDDEPIRWRKSVKNNRLIDKRQAVTYETQVLNGKTVLIDQSMFYLLS